MTASLPPLRWTISQVGARQHFAIPRMAHGQGRLRQLFTDAWVSSSMARLLARLPSQTARRLAGRHHPDLAGARVRAYTWSHLAEQKRSFPGEDAGSRYLRIGGNYARRVAADLARRENDPQQDVFFSFTGGGLESIQVLREQGVFCVHDQISPAQTEENLVAEERDRWPDWAKRTRRLSPAYWQRCQQEWAAASAVMVNSQWSRRALIEQGVDPAKIFVVPIAFEPGELPPPRAVKPPNQPIEVLWLGGVNLRKGIPYLIEAARQLQDLPVHFTVVGPIQISDQAVGESPANMQFTGGVPRSEASRHYARADVFVLPTISDGFAITQLEAMAQGLPVVTTPNCGEVVTDGEDGLIVPIRDADALAGAFGKLIDDRQLLAHMSARALEKVRQFSLQQCFAKIEANVQARWAEHQSGR